MRNFKSLKIKNLIENYKGFTLLELLIVIAVIGVLARIVVVSFPAASKRARDATRRSDIKQYQTAMETYINRSTTGSFYANSGTPDSTDCGTSNLKMSACPVDPKSTWNYTLNSTATGYIIYAQLEQPNDSTKPYFVVCSDGRVGECADPGAIFACATGAGSCP